MTHDANQRKSGLFRKHLPVCLIGCCLFLTGCIYSLQPWYAEDAGGADPALLGIWREVDGQDTWVFLAAGDSLRVLFSSEGQLGEFTAVTFRLKDWTLLDLTPAGPSQPSSTVGWYMYPLHGLHRWQLRGDTLLLGSLASNVLSERLEAGPHPPLEKGENRWVFTGSREEMAGYVAAQLLDEALFSDQTVLVRQ